MSGLGMTLDEFIAWITSDDACAECGHARGTHAPSGERECVAGADEGIYGCVCPSWQEPE